MRVLGFNISVNRAANVPVPTTPLYGDRGSWWWPVIREPFTGAWQKNMQLTADSIVTYFAVYSCLSLISTDIGKLGLRLMKETESGIEVETESAAFSPVLRKPNHYQTRNKFIETWMLSKLIHGNTYVLKERDNRGVVVGLYVLEPTRAKVLVAPDGSIAYSFAADNLSGLTGPIEVPASEVIHDVNTPLFHPLCGISPILGASLSVVQGQAIQKQSANFFDKGSRPGGILTAPGAVPQGSLERIKTEWETRFSGDNAGRVAILTDGLKFESMGVPAEQSQLIEQLKWTAENVCSVFHVPPFMIGIGAAPSFDNVEALNQQYYSQCLQTHIESIESLLDDGLALPSGYETEFDLDDLLRMDAKTNIQTTGDAVKAGFLSPNEARAKFNLLPVKGGESPYLQQQNYNLAALAERGAPPAPTATPTPTPTPAPSPPADPVKVNATRILDLAAAL